MKVPAANVAAKDPMVAPTPTHRASQTASPGPSSSSSSSSSSGRTVVVAGWWMVGGLVMGSAGAYLLGRVGT